MLLYLLLLLLLMIWFLTYKNRCRILSIKILFSRLNNIINKITKAGVDPGHGGKRSS